MVGSVRDNEYRYLKKLFPLIYQKTCKPPLFFSEKTEKKNNLKYKFIAIFN